MADAQKNEAKSFLQLTWQQVISTIIIALFLGVLGWMGSMLQDALDDLEDVKSRMTIAETQIDAGVIKSIDQVRDDLKQITTQLGSTNANQRRIEILVSRLEVIVSKIEEDR